MAYDLLKLARMQDVRDFTEKLKNRTEPLTYNNAGAHNSIYRGKNLGTAITASQIQAIRNGTFADLYVGDEWTLPIDGTTNAYIMGFNIYWGGWGKQHAVVLLSNQNWMFSINDTDTCEGHLYNSKMYTVHLPYILGKIKEVIPEYILTHSGYENGIADAINSSGLVSHRINSTTEQIFLPSLTNITGSEILDNRCAYETFSRNKLWPYFLFNKSGFIGHLWLDSNFDTTHWCFNNGVEHHYYFLPASKVLPVCPYILLG